ncbi:MAG: 50S ribosomal protein L18, partial [Peptoniphilus harei]|nr:50S ribosomal protein L18 [Peptoniphilus harei]
MLNKINRNENRIKRHKRIRNHISGTSMKPRL